MQHSQRTMSTHRHPERHSLRETLDDVFYASGGKYLHIARTELADSAPDRPICAVDHSGMRRRPPAAVPPSHASICPRCAKRLNIHQAAPDHIPPTAQLTNIRETESGRLASAVAGRVVRWLDDPDSLCFWQVPSQQLRVVADGNEILDLFRNPSSHIIRRKINSQFGSDTKAPQALIADIGGTPDGWLAWWPIKDDIVAAEVVTPETSTGDSL